MNNKLNLEKLIPITILGIALFIGLTIGIITPKVTKNTTTENTEEMSEEITTEIATSADVETPTVPLEDIDGNEEDISTEQYIESEPLYESTTEKITEENITTEYIVDSTTQDVNTESPEESKNMTYLGKYTLTAYCPCEYCCGKTDGITASGTQATAGRTVGCNSLPFGTVISINGCQYVVEDRGGMNSNVIDIFFNTHQEALNFGRQTADVYIVN